MRHHFELFVFSSVMVLGMTVSTTSASAAEHPSEHPAEHPAEHSHGGGHITKEALAHAITEYVDQDSKLRGGYFLVYDVKDKKALALKLLKVHKDRLSQIAETTYADRRDSFFACADFKNTNGTVYDLDVFMKGKDADHLTVTEISVHKKSGQARYTWQKKDDIWIKVGVGFEAGLVLASNAEFQIGGMKCQKCADKICSIIKKVPGVKDAGVDFDTGLARVAWDKGTASQELISAVEEAGFTAKPIQDEL